MNGDIQIWNVVEGRVTELKIKNMVMRVSSTKPDDIDPVEVAKVFLETFDVSKRVRYILRVEDAPDTGSISRIYPSTKKPVVEDDNDIIEKINGINILKSCLDVIYNRYMNSKFTRDDVAYTFKNHIGFGGVRIAQHIEYLERNGFIGSQSDGCKTVHQFLKPFETGCDDVMDASYQPGGLIDNVDSTEEQQFNLLMQDVKTTSKNEDIVGMWKRNFIKISKLEKIYLKFKDAEFTQTDIVNRFKPVGGYSSPTVQAHMRYLRNRRWVELVPNKQNSNKHVYKFIVPYAQWRFDKPRSTSLDFDYNEVRKRKLLELETMRQA